MFYEEDDLCVRNDQGFFSLPLTVLSGAIVGPAKIGGTSGCRLFGAWS